MSTIKPMGVLHVAAPARVGGLESVLVELTAGLRLRGHDAQVAVVVTPGEENGHPVLNELSRRGVPLHVIAVQPRDYFGERRAIRRIMGEINVPVLHTHGFRPDVIDGQVVRSQGSAHVTTLHGFVGETRRGRAYEWLQIQAARRADAVIAVSAPIAERLARNGIRGRVHLIPNAVSPARDAFSRREARAQLGLPGDAQVMGWVGRMSREKGPDLFLESLVTAPDLTGFMIGDGPEREAILERASSLGLQHRFHAPGLIPSASRYLAAFDGLALTSRTEGTPMILLEAILATIPVVTTMVGGVPQVVGEEEALACSPSSDSIAHAFLQFCRDPESAKRRAAAALRRVERCHSIDAWLERHERVYHDLTAQPNSLLKDQDAYTPNH